MSQTIDGNLRVTGTLTVDEGTTLDGLVNRGTTFAASFSRLDALAVVGLLDVSGSAQVGGQVIAASGFSPRETASWGRTSR